MALVIIRICGEVNVPSDVEYTLCLLNLDKKYRATIVKEDPSILGMLKKIQHYIAWYKADKDLIKEMLEKRGKVSASKKIDNTIVKELGFDNIDILAEKLANNAITLSSLNIKPWFGLHPPIKGFKRSTKRTYKEKGITGENPELPLLIKRML